MIRTLWRCKNISSPLCRSYTMARETPFSWVVVSDLPRYSRRSDVNAILGDIAPISVESILDGSMFPTGSWLLKFHNPLPYDNIKAACSNSIYGSFNISAPMQHSETRNLKTTLTCGITASTVRVMNVPKYITTEEMTYIFENFKLVNNGIRKLANHPYSSVSEYFVYFGSADEAQKAVVLLTGEVVAGNVLQLWHYL